MLQILIVRKLLNFFDYFQSRKIYKFLRKKINTKSIFFDVGAHHGETIQNFFNYFDVNQIHSFEASQKNFESLKNKIILKNNLNVFINNFGLSNQKKKTFINQTLESSSTTLSVINKNSKYYRKKINTLGLTFDKIFETQEVVFLDTLDNYLNKKKNIKKIDLLKIDTEGHEFFVLKGAKNSLKKIRFIYFEHHYDDMLSKGYKFSDINKFLVKNNFIKVYKSKMYFRKTFEYIYERI